MARRYARFWNRVIRLGVMPRRWVVLEVAGRTTGRPMRVPLGMARLDGHTYLVSMLGECNWTRNVRAADGRALLLRVHRHTVRLVEVPAHRRAPVIRAYVRQVPGGRPHIGVRSDAPLADFVAVADAHPVFLVQRRGSRQLTR